MAARKILLIDDSAVMREFLCSALGAVEGFEVVGTAGNPEIAVRKAERIKPDCILMNLGLSAADSLTLLRKLRRISDLPIVAYTEIATQEFDRTQRALQLGAAGTFSIPDFASTADTGPFIAEVQILLRSLPKRRKQDPSESLPDAGTTTPPVDNRIDPPERILSPSHKVVAIGTSTGGTEALGDVLSRLPADSPGIVAVIHMPAGYTNSYAQRLNRECEVQVAEASDGDEIVPGRVLIAPGDFHMEVQKRGGRLSVRISSGDKVSGFRPSVDVLFHSCARVLGPNAVGALLTGMGRDGAQGLLAMRTSGAHTIAQDEATSTIFGMPKEAIQLGAACQVLPLGQIAGQILKYSRSWSRQEATVPEQP